MDSRSFALYPELAPDPANSEYLARCAHFHMAITQTAWADYRHCIRNQERPTT